MAQDKPVTLAAVAGAHGVTGEVRLKLFGEGFASLKPHKAFNGGTLTVEKLKDDGKGGAIARFAEIPDRIAAEEAAPEVVAEEAAPEAAPEAPAEEIVAEAPAEEAVAEVASEDAPSDAAPEAAVEDTNEATPNSDAGDDAQAGEGESAQANAEG